MIVYAALIGETVYTDLKRCPKVFSKVDRKLNSWKNSQVLNTFSMVSQQTERVRAIIDKSAIKHGRLVLMGFIEELYY